MKPKKEHQKNPITKSYKLFHDYISSQKIIGQIKHPKIHRMLQNGLNENPPYANREGLIFITDEQIFSTYYSWLNNQIGVFKDSTHSTRFHYSNSGDLLTFLIDPEFHKSVLIEDIINENQ